MSNDVVSAGMMAPLSRKLSEEERDEWSELLYDQGSTVSFNYDGTLAYTDVGGDAYGITFGIINVDYSIKGFLDLNQFGISVDLCKVRPYRCQWYNGADSDMGLLTLEEFLERTKQ